MVNKYYEKHKKRLWKEACERYQNQKEKDTKKKMKKGEKMSKIDVKIFLKKKKQKLCEHMKKYYLAHKK